MSDEDRMRSEIARMQMRGDELTDQVRTYYTHCIYCTHVIIMVVKD